MSDEKIIITALSVVVLFPFCLFGQDSLSNGAKDFPLFYVGADFSLIPFSYGKANNTDGLRFSLPLQFSSELNINLRKKYIYQLYCC